MVIKNILLLVVSLVLSNPFARAAMPSSHVEYEEQDKKTFEKAFKKAHQARECKKLRKLNEKRTKKRKRGYESSPQSSSSSSSSSITPEPNVEEVTIPLNAEYGLPTEDGLRDLLLQRYFSANIGAKITVKRVEGGDRSNAVYMASLEDKHKGTRPVFFLKISLNKAWRNLYEIQRSCVGRLGIDARYADTGKRIPPSRLPIMTWVEKFFVYFDNEKKEQTIELIHTAHGVPVGDIIDGKDRVLQKKCAEVMGMALGSFQQAFMVYNDQSDPETWKTISHGDLHPYNVFFDQKTSRVYFIDNETMYLSLNKTGDLGFDLGKFVFNHLDLMTFYDDPQPSRLIPVFEFYAHFVQGYIESFRDNNKRKLVDAYVKNHLKSELDRRLKSSGNIFNVYRVNDKIFKELILALPDDLNAKAQSLLKMTGDDDINFSDSDGWTPLHIAAITGNKKIIEALIKRGAVVDARDTDDITPLRVAVYAKKIEAIEALLKAGADVTISKKNDEPIFYYAVRQGKAAVIKALVESPKFDVNASSLVNVPASRYYDSITPLFYVLQEGRERDSKQASYLDTALVLLNTPKIDLTAKNKDGKTAIEVARKIYVNKSDMDEYDMNIKDKKEKIIQFLEEHGAE